MPTAVGRRVWHTRPLTAAVVAKHSCVDAAARHRHIAEAVRDATRLETESDRGERVKPDAGALDGMKRLASMPGDLPLVLGWRQ